MSTPAYQGYASLAIDVLDHGFVALRNISGPTRRIWSSEPAGDDGMSNPLVKVIPAVFDADDTDPANTARMSFDQTDSGRTREQDLKLADYLMKNKHTTPFEMIEVWLEMKMPIFVARQFVRHRTVSINEVSGRYVTLPAEWYIPEVVGGKAPNAKQGQSDNLSAELQEQFKEDLNMHCDTSYFAYMCAIQDGVAPEHARMFLHLNHYTHWIWKQDLHNLLHFLALRDHSHAQVEAQAYAKAIDKLIRKYLPHSMELYDKYRRL
jgi:thymidylate synthase (FAD)